MLTLVALLGSACGPRAPSDDELGTDGGSDGESTSSETTGSESNGSETTDSETTDSETTDSDGETSTGSICGDGIVDRGEECDLGPENHWHAYCQPDCTLNECGDASPGPDDCTWPWCLSDCPHPPMACGNAIYACGDGIDNDQDGLTDLHDPECLGPCDDDEATFQTNLPGEGRNDCARECFFDANGGSGDDDCEWNLACDPLNPGEWVGCPYDPILAMQENACSGMQSDTCLDRCLPIAPNGCDCFGCCEIGGGYRHLDAPCSADDLDACPDCTPNPDCFNLWDGEFCEMALLDQINPWCDQPSCPEGIEACTDPYGCGEGEFCQAGCCRPVVPSW